MRINSSRTYVRDVKYYFPESKILQEWTAYTDVSGRTIYKTPLYILADESVTLEFKFKSLSTAELSSVVGVDLFSGATYNTRFALLAKSNTATSYYSSNSSYRNKEGTTTPLSVDSVYKIVLTNGTHAVWYKDDVQFASYNIERTTTSNLRYDLFKQNSSRLDYLIIL